MYLSSIVTCLFYELTLFVRLFCLRVTTLLIQQLQLSSSSSLNASLHNTTNKTEEAIHTRIKYYDEYIQRSVLCLKSRRQLSKTANVILAESWSASESLFFVAFTTSIGICTQSEIHSGVRLTIDISVLTSLAKLDISVELYHHVKVLTFPRNFSSKTKSFIFVSYLLTYLGQGGKICETTS